MYTIYLLFGLLLGALIGIFAGFQFAKSLTNEVISKTVSMTLLSLVMNPPKPKVKKESEDKSTNGRTENVRKDNN